MTRPSQADASTMKKFSQVRFNSHRIHYKDEKELHTYGTYECDDQDEVIPHQINPCHFRDYIYTWEQIKFNSLKHITKQCFYGKKFSKLFP